MYFTVTNGGQADRLIGAESAAADSIEIHESTTGEDGMMGMDRLDGLDVAANETVVLAPGGYHLMLIGVDRLDVGEMIDVTLTWEKAGDMVVEAKVVEPSDTMGEHD
jgi:copper(I)-binding protein